MKDNTLNEISNALLGFGIPVRYGQMNFDKIEKWNYFVFGRSEIKPSGRNLIDMNVQYTVAIVMEDFIPDGFEIEVIEKITENTNLRLSSDSIQIDYMIKPNSGNLCVEMMQINFFRVRKGCRCGE